MAVGRILRKSLVKELEITGQQVVSGEYQEAINKFETVAQLIPFENPDVKVKLPNPDILPTGSGRRTAFSPDDTYLAVAHNTSPFIAIYKRSGDTFTKLANPDILPTGTGFGTAFSPDSTYLAVGHSNTPFITIYKRSGDTFTKLANPDTLPPAQSQHGGSVDFSPNGTYLALSYFAFPSVNPKWIIIYKRSGDTFTKLADPAILPADEVLDLNFSPDSTYLAVAHQFSPFITIYKRSGDTFTKLADPSQLPEGPVGWSTAFSPDGTYLAVGSSASPFITIYKRSGDTFTKLANPNILPGNNADFSTPAGAAFSPDGNYLALGHSNTPFITIYKRSGDTFTKLADPSELPPGSSRLSFNPDGTYLALGHSGFPYITIYKNAIITNIVKANNLIEISDAEALGYALENGAAGETKTMMSLFREEE